MSKLKLAADLSLPLDAVTQTFLVVGKRGSGKSNTAARFVEQLYKARIPFVVLDPVDTWWGLKAGRDGGEGLGVYVFGGSHKDLPLEPGGGALIAGVLCEHRIPMVLSVKHLSGRERSTFMTDFAKTLFQKWAGGPLHVVLEEAHELAPQSAVNGREGEQEMLGAFKRLWKLGRASGIGGTAVTQRPASLSKDITTQSEILIAHRTIGPQDVKAVGEWVKYHGEHEGILADLPTLPTGEAFVWAPEFPEGQAIGLKRVAVLRRETYDSASTPKVGEQRVEPKELAQVDMERLRDRMAATIEKAKADDPKELRKQLADKNKEIARLVAEAAKQANPKNDAIRQPAALTDADRALLERLLRSLTDQRYLRETRVDEHLKAMGVRLKSAADQFAVSAARVMETELVKAIQGVESKGLQKVLDKLANFTPAVNQGRPVSVPTHATLNRGQGLSRPTVPARPAAQAAGDSDVGNGGLRRILIALAQRQQGLTLRQIGVRAGLSSKSGTFSTYMSRGRQAGWIHGGGKGGPSVITDLGRAALGDYDPLPEGRGLYLYWLSELGESGAARILQALVEAAPNTLTSEELGERANLNPKSGTFSTYLSRLRTLELITSGRGWLKASEELFS